MTPLDLVTLIGNVLTDIDRCLAAPGLPDSDPRWHQLYALRKALDDHQRDLVATTFQEDSSDYVAITKNLSDASAKLKTTLDDLKKITQTITTVTQIVGFVGQVLHLTAM